MTSNFFKPALSQDDHSKVVDVNSDVEAFEFFVDTKPQQIKPSRVKKEEKSKRPLRPLKQKLKIPEKELIIKDVDDIRELNPKRARTKLHAIKISNKKQSFLERVESKKRAELLNKEHKGYLVTKEGVSTDSIRQIDILEQVDVATSTKHFNLDLDYGPYCIDYTNNGRHLLLGGKDGHLAAFDWQTKNLHTEIIVNERVKAVKWLQNENAFAVAQKRWTHIYDRNGTELHCIKSFFEVHSLEFLPRHFLLAGLSNTDYLHYLDVSSGKLVSSQRLLQRNFTCFTHNPTNAVVIGGNAKGVVSMWTPNNKEAAVEMLAHKAPLSAVTVERSGVYMVTTSLDKQLKLWDLRTYAEVCSLKLPLPATKAVFSQTRKLAVSFGKDVQIYSKITETSANQPYLKYETNASISSLQFCPYEDVLGIGYDEGFHSILVPGSGDPNFDALNANPYESKKQRQEREVKQLLEKLQPSMISLNPSDINRVNQTVLHQNIDYRDKVLHRKKSKINVNPSRYFEKKSKKTLK